MSLDPESAPVWHTREWWQTLLLAQARIGAVLLVAYIGNWWPHSYQRNQNADPLLFWTSCVGCLVGALATIVAKKERPHPKTGEIRRKIVFLCREQTEEWKGWMQWAFIFYHYYRARYVYNEIRVFVSSYVWMTGFGNFLYFDKKKDFSLTRVVSMMVRINWFPLSLCLGLWVSIELYYVVPLHSAGFLMTWATCYLQQWIEKQDQFLSTVEKYGSILSPYWASRVLGVILSLLAHFLFYETGFCSIFFFWSEELAWRFAADRYSAWQGLVCGMFVGHVQDFLQWMEDQDDETDCIIPGTTAGDQRSPVNTADPSQGVLQADPNADDDEDIVEQPRSTSSFFKRKYILVKALQSFGVFLMLFWYFAWGYNEKKLEYNGMHPFIMGIPIVGYVLLRNSTYFLTMRYSWFLESLGRNTLETYVLQFHVFMCRDVQHILCLLPGSHIEANNFFMRVLNMLLLGVGFVLLAGEARKATVTTQDCFIELVNSITGNTETQKASEVLKQGGFGAAHKQEATQQPASVTVSVEMSENIVGKPASSIEDQEPLKQAVGNA